MHAAFCAVAEGGDCNVQVAGLFGNLMANTVDAAAASSDDAHANGVCCHCWFLRELYQGSCEEYTNYFLKQKSS